MRRPSVVTWLDSVSSRIFYRNDGSNVQYKPNLVGLFTLQLISVRGVFFSGQVRLAITCPDFYYLEVLVRLSRIFLLSLIAVSTSSAFAQAAPEDWVPQAIHSLGQNASSRTEFALDHSMLVLASKLDQDDQDLRRVIAGVDGVSVHEFRFRGAATYDPETLNAVRQEYHAAGWKRLANPHEKNGQPTATELWLHFENNAIRNIAILHAGESQIDFVEVSGSISPLDLMHLAGHFGIPRIEGGVVVPAPSGGQ